MAGRFSVEAIFKAVDRVTRPVKRMQNRVGKFTRSMSRGFFRANRAVNGFARNIKRAGLVAVASFALITAGMINVLGAGANFEQAIVNVGAVSLQTRNQIASLEKQALDLGRTTKFTATQAANAMEVLARAGFNTQEILSATPAVLNAAAASGLEIAEVADIVSNSLKGMGLEISQAANVADVLALASSRTNSTIGSLGESIKNVASTARQLNVPFEEVVASVALLQDVGLDASVAGSAFNVMLTKMAAPSVGLQKKMRRLGISFKDTKGNMLPLPAVLNQLSIASKKVGGNFDQVAFLAELVGLRGQKAAANLSKLFETGKIEKLTSELKNAAGSAKKMADIRMNTVNGSLLLLSSAVDAVKVKIFGLNSGPLKDTIDKMTAWVSANEDLIASNIGNFIGDVIDNLSNIVKWIKRVAIGLAVFISFAAILKIIVGVMTLVNLVMAANPITLVILGIVALIAVLTAVVFWWDGVKSAIMGLSGPIKALAIIIAFLMGPITLLITVATLIIAHWEPIAAFFINLWDGIVNVFNSAIDGVLNILNKLTNSPAARLFKSIWEPIGNFFTNLWSGIVSVFNSAIDLISSAISTLTNVVMAVMEIFQGLPGPVKAAIAILSGPIGWFIAAASLIMDNWEPISEFFADLWEGIKSTFSIGLDFITGIFDKMFVIFDNIKTFFSDVGSNIATFFGFGDEISENPASAKAKITEAVVQPDVIVDQPTALIEPVVNVKTPELSIVPNLIVDQSTALVDPMVNVKTPELSIVPNVIVNQPTVLIEPVVNVKTPELFIVPNIIVDQPTANDDEFAPIDVDDQGPQIVSPQERIARSIEESRKSSFAEVTIRDETGRAEKTNGEFGNNIKLQKSGTF